MTSIKPSTVLRPSCPCVNASAPLSLAVSARLGSSDRFLLRWSKPTKSLDHSEFLIVPSFLRRQSRSEKPLNFCGYSRQLSLPLEVPGLVTRALSPMGGTHQKIDRHNLSDIL